MWEKWKRWDLPTNVKINNRTYEIESDFRVVLRIFEALNDEELLDMEKIDCAMYLFFPSYREDENGNREMLQEDVMDAFQCLSKFLSGNTDDTSSKKTKHVYDWEQDFNLIIAPINRIAGHDVRIDRYIHWWTFLSYFMEIGECTFSTYVSIRDKMARGKKLESWERELLKKNPDIRLKSKKDYHVEQLFDDLKKAELDRLEVQGEIDSLLGR